MGQITSVLSGLSSVNAAINHGGRIADLATGQDERLKNLRAQQEQALGQLRSRQTLEETLSANKRAGEQAIIKGEAEAAERRRLQALKAATARQRAQFGAAGVDADDGSGEAVLLGLFTQSEAERAEQERLYALRQRILDAEGEAVTARNLLEYTQMRDTQALRRRLI